MTEKYKYWQHLSIPSLFDLAHSVFAATTGVVLRLAACARVPAASEIAEPGRRLFTEPDMQRPIDCSIDRTDLFRARPTLARPVEPSPEAP
jgi:hypothetical protein